MWCMSFNHKRNWNFFILSCALSYRSDYTQRCRCQSGAWWVKRRISSEFRWLRSISSKIEISQNYMQFWSMLSTSPEFIYTYKYVCGFHFMLKFNHFLSLLSLLWLCNSECLSNRNWAHSVTLVQARKKKWNEMQRKKKQKNLNFRCCFAL